MRYIRVMLCCLVGIFMTFQVNAIKPTRTYSHTPEAMKMEYEELYIKTSDGFALKVWHLPAENNGSPIIISQSDAGNMGDWLILGYIFRLTDWMCGCMIIEGSDRAMTLRLCRINCFTWSSLQILMQSLNMYIKRLVKHRH